MPIKKSSRSEPMNSKPAIRVVIRPIKNMMAPKVVSAKPAAKIGKKSKIDGKKKLNTRKKNCVGGFPGCKTRVGDYKGVDGAGYCDSCDNYVDQNPWDPVQSVLGTHA